MDDAKKARKKIVEWIAAVEMTAPVAGAASHGMEESIESFSSVMDEDLNTSAAIADIFAVMNAFYKWEKVSAKELDFYHKFVAMIRATFGCFDPELEEGIPSDVQALVDERATARAAKNFAESDRLRDEIAKRGFEVRDVPEGQTVKKL